jgi:CRP-like cAMP-binding protein
VSVIAAQKLSNFFSKFKKYFYKKGETILRGGDVPQGVCFIGKGYVKDYSVSREGEELTLIMFKPGDFFPMQWVFNAWINVHYFEAATPVEIWRCSKEDFVTFIKANPDVFFELTSRIMLRLGGILQRMEYLAFGNSYEKVVSIISIFAERFGKKVGKNIVIQVPFTHKDIASFLGLARETASVEIKKLERKGLIAYRGKLILVRNKNKLRQESLLTNP